MLTTRYVVPTVAGVSGVQTIRLTDRGNSGTPLVQMTTSSDFVGSVLFQRDISAPGGTQSLSSCVCRLSRSSDPVTDYAAGEAFGSSINVEPSTSGAALFAVVTMSAGAVTIVTFRNWPGTPDEPTVYLRNVTLSTVPITYPDDLAFQFEAAYNTSQE